MTTIHMFQCLLVHTCAANILISKSYYIGRWNKDCASTVVSGRLAFSCTKMFGGHPAINSGFVVVLSW